ncbi:MAG: chemotaxis protein CheB, partial [Myxococcota bacterium]
MPGMDGLQTLSAIRQAYPSLPIIIFSAFVGRGTTTAREAMALGANDCAIKPIAAGGAVVSQLSTELFPKIRALCKIPARLYPPSSLSPARIEAIGASTGGPNALFEILAGLPADLCTPVLIVQHMPAVFTRLLADRLHSRCELPVKEARAGDVLQAGHVYIAPGDHHMIVERRDTQMCIGLNRAPAENACRPAVDALFRSVAATFGADTLAVVLTGMGRDGLEGCRRLRHAGARIICQDESSSVVWGMPGYVAHAGIADEVVPLSRISRAITVQTQIPSSPRATARTERWS